MSNEIICVLDTLCDGDECINIHDYLSDEEIAMLIMQDSDVA